MALTDYGARYILEKTFENTDVFQVALFTSGATGDIPTVVEVTSGNAGYARVNITGGAHGSFDYQTLAGLPNQAVGDGIAAYVFDTNSSGTPIQFVFTGPLTGGAQTITGYAILIPGSWSNPFSASAVLEAKTFDNPYTPRNNGDTLIIDSINIRLSKGTVS